MRWTEECAGRLRDLRVSWEMSLRGLAYACEVSATRLDEWERAKQSPLPVNLIALAEALGVTTPYLLCQTDDPKGYAEPFEKRSKGVRDGRTPDLDHIFTYHRPDEEARIHYDHLREAAHAFAKAILDHTPPGADQSAAIRKVREAIMTANAAVALDGRLTK